MRKIARSLLGLIGGMIASVAVAEESTSPTFHDNGLANQKAPTIPLGYHFVSMSEWNGGYMGFEGVVEGTPDHSALVVNIPAGPRRGAYVAAAFADGGTHYGGLKNLVDGERITKPLTMPWDMAFGYDTFARHTDEFDFSRITNLVAGINLSEAVRIEGEVSYLQHDVDVFRSFVMANQDLDADYRVLGIDADKVLIGNIGRVRTKTSFANAIFDLPFGKKRALSPYIGAGVGLAEVDIDFAPDGISIIDESKMTFAHQLMLGASFRSREGMEIVMNARYRGMIDGDFVDVSQLVDGFTIENENFVGELGLRKDF